MKIIICGKGGSGKSTVSALLTKELSTCGFKVVLIDADESNTSLHRLMGINAPKVIMDDLGGKKGFREKTQSSFPGGQKEIFNATVTWNDLAGLCGGDKNPKLISIGKIHEPGEGCACPMGALSKMLLSRLTLRDDELVIIDTSAGIEHFGRGIDSHSDLVIGVIDPSYESMVLSQKMISLSEKAGIPICFILNRSTERTKQVITDRIDMDKIIAIIENRDDIFHAGFLGELLPEGGPGVRTAAEWIINMKRGAANTHV